MRAHATKTSGKSSNVSSRARARDALLDERLVFARKIRGARAILGWTQTELASRTGLSQPSIHRIERGTGELRHSAVVTLERFFLSVGISFEDLSDGGFRIVFKS